MAINITCSNFESYLDIMTANWMRYIRVTSLTGTISVSFTGITPTGEGTYRSYNQIKEYRKDVLTNTYEGTSHTFSYSASDFNYLDASKSGYAYLKIALGTGGFMPENLPDQDVYINGTKYGTFQSTNIGYVIYVMPHPNYFKPQITNCSDLAIQSIEWNGLPIAGESILQIENVTFGNARSDDPNNYFYVSAEVYGGAGTYDYTKTKLSDYSYKISNINCPSSESTAYSITVYVRVTNRFGGQASVSRQITVYPYHLSRLFLNTTGNVSYTTRCQQDGTADGLGSYGKLHLVWDVAKINTTGSGTINTLQSASVVLNGTTTLSPKNGSISDGYLEYIFPLDLSVQGNLSITLTDTRKTNIITALSVPKGSMPFSMYDDGGHVGVAFGTMASEAGAWCYMPFYLKSSTDNSSKMFQIKVYDDGTIKAVEV